MSEVISNLEKGPRSVSTLLMLLAPEKHAIFEAGFTYPQANSDAVGRNLCFLFKEKTDDTCGSTSHNKARFKRVLLRLIPAQDQSSINPFRRLQERPPDHRVLLLDPHLYGRPRASGKRGPSGRSPHLPPVLTGRLAESHRYGPRSLKMHAVNRPDGLSHPRLTMV